MRATLHDELMREAGFDTQYHRELEHRREHRRRATIRAAVPVAWLILFAAVLVELVAVQSHGIPEFLAIAAVVVGGATHSMVRLIKRQSRQEQREQLEQLEHAELVASIEGRGRIAERREDPERRRLSRRELLLLPLPATMAGAVLAPSGWWLSLGVVAVVCLAAYLYLGGLDKALRSN